MVKFFNSLCCCVYSAEVRKSRRHNNAATPSSNVHSIITQITPESVQNGSSHVNGNGATTWTSSTQEQLQKQHQEGGFKDANMSSNTAYRSKNNQSPGLLARPSGSDAGKKCLVVDLDETLVHSSFKPVKNADFVIPVEIDNIVHQVYVLKRPFADEFLEKIGPLFECVLFTASLAKYADPVSDLLDKKRVFRARLFREACVYYDGNYIKDLDRLGRNVNNVIIIDNSPASYAFHPRNAVPVRTWFDDPHDTELLDMIPVLERLAKTDNIYPVLKELTDEEHQLASRISFDDGNHTVVVSSGQIGINIGNRPTKEYLFSPNVGTDKVKT